jgi:hypothetical protein
MSAPTWFNSDSISRQWMLQLIGSWKIARSSCSCLWLMAFASLQGYRPRAYRNPAPLAVAVSRNRQGSGLVFAAMVADLAGGLESAHARLVDTQANP